MAKALKIDVKESLSDLRKLQKESSRIIRPRIQMLIEIKKSEVALSKEDLSHLVGCNHNSVSKWRRLYREGGLTLLCSHQQGGVRRSVVDSKTKEALKKRLNSARNGFRSYKEMQRWLEEEMSVQIKYITLVKYVQRHFQTKLKAARKSHVRKNEEAVEAFKKNP